MRLFFAIATVLFFSSVFAEDNESEGITVPWDIKPYCSQDKDESFSKEWHLDDLKRIEREKGFSASARQSDVLRIVLRNELGKKTGLIHYCVYHKSPKINYFPRKRFEPFCIQLIGCNRPWEK